MEYEVHLEKITQRQPVAIREWCLLHKHALAGPNWEIHGHWLEEWNSDPSRIRTDIFYLLSEGR